MAGPDADRVEWPWLTPFGAEKLAASRGSCEVRLGRPVAATEVLGEALAAPTLTVRRRGELLVDLGLAHAKRREPVEACAVLAEALTISTMRRSPLLLERVREVRGNIENWRYLPEVAEFDERLYTTWL